VLLKEHPEVDVDEYKNRDGGRALGCACLHGHTDCASLLIDHKADVNARDRGGWSALCGAAFEDDSLSFSCVKLLVQNGADVNSQSNDGWTPLMLSVKNLTMAQYLLDHKADVYYRVSYPAIPTQRMSRSISMTSPPPSEMPTLRSTSTSRHTSTNTTAF
jgi:ankyrin repeat protein